MNKTNKTSAPLTLPIIAAMLATPTAYSAEAPADWLGRMSAAMQNTSYAGTVIRTRGDDAEALKVVRRIEDGVVSEKVTVQEGNGLEIIRKGNEVHCILPDSKSVLVEPWQDEDLLFSTLPDNDIGFGHQYDLSLVREERVAGRMAVLLAIRPHDEFRFGHRIWLDRDTAFPLRTELVDGGGSLLEQVKFADINLAASISKDALAPSISLENFTFQPAAEKRIEVDVENDWVCDDLPAGFRILSTKSERLPGSEFPVTHILYSDGLASVSVFIARAQSKPIAQRSNVGGSNAYSLQTNDYQITAVGGVPAVTTERIASCMRQQ
jgi:sigma-E factor negative regulatory protein RseB